MASGEPGYLLIPAIICSKHSNSVLLLLPEHHE
jgi:hypothetical protein